MMKKRMAAAMLAILCLLFCSMPGQAENLHLEYEFYLDGLILTHCSLSAPQETLTIPDTIFEGTEYMGLERFGY